MLSPATPAPAATRPQARPVAIERQPLGDALLAFARQADVQVLYAPDLVRGRQAAPIRGAHPPAEALRALLAGSGVAIRRVSADGRTFSLAAATGDVTGRLLSDATGEPLAGASVQVRGGGPRQTTDRDGRFAFSRLAAGAYVLSVTYEGFLPQEIALVVGEGRIHRDIRLAAMVHAQSDLQELLVVGRLQGQAQALNLQRTAPSLRTVVSADALGQIREGNIGDALVRLPGLSVETRAGVQRTATIRGLSPQYNSITVDGLRMTNVDGNRDIALDSFPSNMLARVQVIKSPTSDMSADAIGGTVDLVTPSAFDYSGPYGRAHLGGAYNARLGNWNTQAGLTLSRTFGDAVGLLVSADYYRDERGYDAVETGYTADGAGVAAINHAFYYDRNEVKDRIGGGVALDYRASDRTRLYARVLYMNDARQLLQRGSDYRPNLATQVDVTPDGASSTAARIDQIAFYREPENVFQMYYGGLDQRLGAWDFTGRAAYSKAQKRYPRTLQITNSISVLNLSYDRSVRDFPRFQLSNEVDPGDPSRLAFQQFDTNQVPRKEDEWTLDGRLGRDVGGAVPWRLEAGVRASWKKAAQAQPLTVRYSGLAGIDPASLVETYINRDFLRAADGRAAILPTYPSWSAYLRLQQTNPAAFTQNAAAALFTSQARESADFAIDESIYAGYVQAGLDAGSLHLLGGVRVEHTQVDSLANRVVTLGLMVVSTPARAHNGYTSVLPGVQARYALADERLVLRAAVTTGISRPPQGDLVAASQENLQANQRVIGNPDLKPARSLNIDVSADYLFPPLGLVSVAIYYKDIDRFVFSASRTATDGVDERTRVNGDGGKVLGLEAAWVQRLDFLPAPLQGLAVETNLTLLRTTGAYPGRADALTLANAPAFAFNGIVSYTAGPVDVRLSYNHLTKRLESVGLERANDRYYAATSVLDLAIKLKIRADRHLFLNVKNLTDEPTVLFQGSRDLPTAVTYYGRQFNGGIVMTF